MSSDLQQSMAILHMISLGPAVTYTAYMQMSMRMWRG